MNQDESNRQMNDQTDRFRQEQRAAEDRQNEERQRSEERTRAESAAQEQRRREEDSRREEQRRQDDRRRQDDERRRSEQQKQDNSRRQENQSREQRISADSTIHESHARTLYEKSKENQQAQYAREKGVPYVETGAVVNSMYRSINEVNKAQYDVNGKPIPEWQRMGNKEEKDGERTTQSKTTSAPDKGQGKESPAMEKYMAHEKALSEKVQDRISTQSQTMAQSITR